jgi:hypothetical protein
MVDIQTVRRMVEGWPEVTDDTTEDRLAFACRGKSFAWTFLERIAPRKPRVAQPEVLAVRCATERKEMLIAAAPEVYFDDDHYRGFPAVLVRLEAIGAHELRGLLESATREISLASKRH